MTENTQGVKALLTLSDWLPLADSCCSGVSMGGRELLASEEGPHTDLR